MTKPIDLDAIKARLAAATPGPWEWTNDLRQRLITSDGDRELVRCAALLHPQPADAALIAHAPEDLAALVAEVERLGRRLGMTRANAVDDLAELRDENLRLEEENERLRAVAEAAGELLRLSDIRGVRDIDVFAQIDGPVRAALDAWRDGEGK